MRILLDGSVFNATFSTIEIGGKVATAIVIDNTIILTPEDVSTFHCALAEATQDEREALRQAGFQNLLEE